MKRVISAFGLTLALAACASPIEIAERNCAAYAFEPGTPQWPYCLQTEANANIAARQASLATWAAMPAQRPAQRPAQNDTQHTYSINGRLVSCYTRGTITTCN